MHSSKPKININTHEIPNWNSLHLACFTPSRSQGLGVPSISFLLDTCYSVECSFFDFLPLKHLLFNWVAVCQTCLFFVLNPLHSPQKNGDKPPFLSLFLPSLQRNSLDLIDSVSIGLPFLTMCSTGNLGLPSVFPRAVKSPLALVKDRPRPPREAYNAEQDWHIMSYSSFFCSHLQHNTKSRLQNQY